MSRISGVFAVLLLCMVSPPASAQFDTVLARCGSIPEELGTPIGKELPGVGLIKVQGPVHPSLPPRDFVDAENSVAAPDGFGVVASLVIDSHSSRAGWFAFLVKVEGEPATVAAHSPLFLYWFPLGGLPVELTSTRWVGFTGNNEPASLRAQGDRLLTACFGAAKESEWGPDCYSFVDYLSETPKGSKEAEVLWPTLRFENISLRDVDGDGQAELLNNALVVRELSNGQWGTAPTEEQPVWTEFQVRLSLLEDSPSWEEALAIWELWGRLGIRVDAKAQEPTVLSCVQSALVRELLATAVATMGSVSGWQRFAAVENVPTELKAKALSDVLPPVQAHMLPLFMLQKPARWGYHDTFPLWTDETHLWVSTSEDYAETCDVTATTPCSPDPDAGHREELRLSPDNTTRFYCAVAFQGGWTSGCFVVSLAFSPLV